MKQPKKLLLALLCLILVIAVTVGCTFTGAESKPSDAEPTETTEPTEESTQPTETTAPTEPTTEAAPDYMDTTVEVYLHEGLYRIPQLSLDNAYGQTVNDEILDMFADTSKYKSIKFFDYWQPWNSHLSLLIEAVPKEGLPIYVSYNIDLQTGEEATLEQLFSADYVFYNDVNKAIVGLFTKELYERYVSTGSLSYDAQTDALYSQNLVAWDELDSIPWWIDSAGFPNAAVEYESLDGTHSVELITPGVVSTSDSIADFTAVSVEEISFLAPVDEYTDEKAMRTLPFLLMQGARAAEINAEILRTYHDTYRAPQYTIAEHGDILSIAICAPDEHGYGYVSRVYNIDKSTGGCVPNEKICRAVGMDEEEYREQVKAVLLNQFFCELPDNLADADFMAQIIEQTVSEENIARCVPYLDAEGKLWIMGTVYLMAGPESITHLMPVTDCEWTDAYLQYISQ